MPDPTSVLPTIRDWWRALLSWLGITSNRHRIRPLRAATMSWYLRCEGCNKLGRTCVSQSENWSKSPAASR